VEHVNVQKTGAVPPFVVTTSRSPAGLLESALLDRVF
jgi:hypothetical protein